MRTFVWLLALLISGCGAHARILVTRPAGIDASAAGNTFSVGPLPGDERASTNIRRDLEQRITNSLNRTIRLVAEGGGIYIDGEVIVQRYEERIDREETACSRQEQTGTDTNGQPVYETRNYPCVRLARVADLETTIRLRVSSGGTAVFDQTYTDRDQQVTRGMESPYPDENGAPPRIDGYGILDRLNAGIVATFSRIILPWQDEVSVRYHGCGDERCTRGYELVRDGNLEGGERLFTEVLGEYGSPTAQVPENLVNRVSEALYNRGVTRGYMGRYAPAVADLSRACAMRPDEGDWARELTNIQRLASDQEALRSQGVIQTETQDVQTAGAP